MAAVDVLDERVPGTDHVCRTETFQTALLGATVGAVGVAFTHILYRIEDGCDWVWQRLVRGPEWLRPAVGGLLLSGLLLLLPRMYGVGYPVLAHAIDGRYVLWFLLILMVGKMVAASLTIGIGGSGGVFALSLFIGAMGGTAFGIVVHHLFPAATAAPGMYGLIGMGAAFAGATRAAITAVIILFELTGQYTIILPLMLAIVAATAVSHALSKETIYTLKLARRGVDLNATPGGHSWLGQVRVAAVMEPLPDPLAADTAISAAGQALWRSAHGVLPVMGADERYHGCVTARALAEAIANTESADRTIADLAQMPPKITETSTLVDALHALAGADGTGLPVLDRDGTSLVGWITHSAILTTPRPTGAMRDKAALRGPLAHTQTDQSAHLDGEHRNDDPRRPSPLLRAVLRAPLRLYDWHAGWLLGHRFLRLTHLGHRSGRRYQTVVEVLKTDPTTGEVMVMSGFGRTTDWLRNIQAHPAVEITLGRDRFTPVHRILDEPDAAAVLADYEHHNRLITPIVRRVLSGLVGWTYDGTDDARHRLVRELLIIAFRPGPDR